MNEDAMENTPMRCCNHCGGTFPETPEYFYRGKGYKGGIVPQCKTCSRKKYQEYREAARQRFLDRGIEPGEGVSTKICSRCGTEKPATLEYFYERLSAPDGLRGVCIDCRKAQSAQWVKDNPERARQNGRGRQARQRRHKRKLLLARTRKWKAENRDKVRQYREENRAKFAVYSRRRRDRVNGLPHSLTPEEWQRALVYFDYRCAVCRRPLDGLFHTAAVDHWIPASNPDCPGTVATNVVPLCHGVGGCNNSKGARDPKEWLEATFGTKKAQQIQRRIEDYLQHIANSAN